MLKYEIIFFKSWFKMPTGKMRCLFIKVIQKARATGYAVARANEYARICL